MATGVPLWDHIQLAARQRPDACAVVDPAGPIAYRTLVHDVDALATELIERGVTRADMVGLHLGFSYLHLLMVLALDRLSIPSMSFAVAAGAALPPVAPHHGLTVVISGTAAPAEPPCRWISLADHQRPKTGAIDAARLAALDSPPDALVQVSWSSGTTGGVKGTPLLRRIQVLRLDNRRLLRGIGPHTRYFTGMPLSSVTGYLMALAVLAAGGTVVLPTPAMDFVSLANLTGVTLTSGPPARLAELIGATGDRGERLETMACFEVLGAHLPSDVARQALRVLTPNLWTVYGATEVDRIATAPVTVSILDPSAVGTVTPWSEVEIVDSQDRPLPAGREGMLRLRGAHMATGYFNDAAATQQNFRDGWFYPGDIGMLTEQRLLRVTSRVEDVIRRGEASLSPLPIEAAIRALPGVRDVAVFGLAGADGAPEICAALVIAPGTDTAPIHAAAVAQLGDRAPTQLFVIERLPRNEHGKVLRRQLVGLAQRARQR